MGRLWGDFAPPIRGRRADDESFRRIEAARAEHEKLHPGPGPARSGRGDQPPWPNEPIDLDDDSAAGAIAELEAEDAQLPPR